MQFGAAVRDALQHSSSLALLFSFMGGVIAALNPCCVAIYATAAATCCASQSSGRRFTWRTGAVFALGAAIANSLLGIGAALFGRLIGGPGTIGRYLVALVPLVMGLQVLGWLPWPRFLPNTSRLPANTGPLITGFVLALVLSPCGTPILATVLSYAAYRQNIIFGAVLLVAYGAGTAIPLLVVATAMGTVGNWFQSLTTALRLQQVTGATLLIIGFFLLWRA